jgi:phosphate starvation-inducible PhoH-like protein
MHFQNELSKTVLHSIKQHKIKNVQRIQTKSENQQKYMDFMRNNEVDIIVAIGPAGTGKTMLACHAAVEALRLKKIQKIVITRPVVSVDEELGFLPGNVESKMDPWTRPLFDVLRETYSPKEIEKLTEDGILEIVPLGFMRGRTFKNTWIIADEMQNSSPTQMLMLATRIGENSKMVITGDLNQSDRNGINGLQEITRKITVSHSQQYIRAVFLEMEDVQRSRAAKAVLEMYSSKESVTPPSTPNNSPAEPLKTEQPFIEEEEDWIDLKKNGDAALIPLERNPGFFRTSSRLTFK